MKERMDSLKLSPEKNLEVMKKRWRELCNIFYLLHDKCYLNRSGKDELELKRARKRIIRRSLEEFSENKETLLNFPKFQITLEKKESETDSVSNDKDFCLMLKVTRLKYLQEVINQIRDFLKEFRYNLIEIKDKEGEYLIVRL